MVKTVKSKAEAQNLIDYMHTSFFRFMMLLAKNGHNLTNRVYRYVPVLDLSKKWTDKMLFKRYGFTKTEQDFIKSVIKDINTRAEIEAALNNIHQKHVVRPGNVNFGVKRQDDS